MNTVLLVEDERYVRADIRYAIESRLPEVRVLEAENGFQAFDIILSTPVDAVLTDIRMPEMDGLVFLRCVRERRAALPVAVLSGYDDFAYMRAALKLGVTDYLRKPASDDEIERLLREMLAHGAARGADEHAPAQRTQRWVYRRLGYYPGDGEPSFPPRAPYWLAVLQLSAPALWPERESLDGLMRAQSAAIGQLEARLADMTAMKSPQNRYHLLLIQTGEESDPRARLREAFAEIRARSGVELVAGVAKAPEADALAEAYLRAQCALLRRFLDPRETVFACERAANAKPGRRHAAVFLSALSANRSGEQLRQAAHMAIRMSMEEGLSPAQLALMFAEMFEGVLSRRTVREARYLSDAYLSGEIVNGLRDAEEWAALLLGAAEEDGQGDDADAIIERVKRYVDGHYQEAINLNTVAGEFALHPKTLSRRFKALTGQNFANYLQDMRIREACRLIEQSTMNIQDVSIAVGYSDPQYFYRVFKQCTGCTPIGYRAGRGKNP